MTPKSPLKVLIIGGYGTFGGRLAELLALEPRLHLIVAGRSLTKAQAFASRLTGKAEKGARAVDRDGDIAAQLRSDPPHIVVDASGPFQSYGAQPYRVVEACLALGISYIDLADASDFVAGIAQFDAAARAKALFVLSGVSTCPALTGAVVRDLTQNLSAVETISAGIAPTPCVDVGLSVVRAIASRAGQRTTIVQDGRETIGFPSTQMQRMTIAPPGTSPLDSKLFSLVDVPELRDLRDIQPNVRTIFFGAAPSPTILHWLLCGLAWLVRWRVVPSLAPLSGLFHQVLTLLRGEDARGGMIVSVTGRGAQNAEFECSWHLIAERGDGAYIPAMPAAALIQRCLEGSPPQAGARSAIGELALADFVPFFVQRAITTGRRSASASDIEDPLFQQLLGHAWPRLPAALRAAHEVNGRKLLRGTAVVTRGKGWVAHCLAELMRLPREGSDVPVEVSFERIGGKEIWCRRFGGRVFKSELSEGRGRARYLLCERFGPITVQIAPVVDRERLYFVVRGWSVFGIPLPASLAPGGSTYESGADDAFRFCVEIRHPWMGDIVHYQGALIPVAVPA